MRESQINFCCPAMRFGASVSVPSIPRSSLPLFLLAVRPGRDDAGAGAEERRRAHPDVERCCGHQRGLRAQVTLLGLGA